MDSYNHLIEEAGDCNDGKGMVEGRNKKVLPVFMTLMAITACVGRRISISEVSKVRKFTVFGFTLVCSFIRVLCDHVDDEIVQILYIDGICLVYCQVEV